VEKLIVVALWFLSMLASGLIGFLVSYLKKKGENLATHEDIALLVDQVRAVTTATKEIEAKISTEVWGRQKRWEMKRDVLFEATKRLAAVQEALGNLNVTFATARKSPQGDAAWVKHKVEANEHWFDEIRKFEETQLLIGITCGEEAKGACDDFRAFAVPTAAQINTDDPEIYRKSAPEMRKKSSAISAAIRKELQTDKATT
jgi:hypothetical protein